MQQKLLNQYTLIEKIGKPKPPHILTAIIRSQTNQYFILKKYICNSEDIKKQIKKIKILQHPNILQIKDVVIQGNFVYIIEEYCEQGDLGYHIRRQIKKNKGPYDQKVVAKWLLQTLLAIQIFHNNHKLHLNIQPKNIYLTSQGNLKLNQKGSFSQVFQSVNDSPKKFKTQQERQRYFQLQSKKDIFSFGELIYSICNLKKGIFNTPNNKKQINKISKQVQDIFWYYSKPLNIIYFACIKKAAMERPSAKQILKTSYFLETMREFIIDKKLNVSIFTRVPIKKYTVHKVASQSQSIKEKLKANKQNKKQQRKSVDKLPKIDTQSQNQNNQTPPNIFRKSSRQKKQNSQTKCNSIQRSSVQKRRKYSQDMKKSQKQKKELPQIFTPKPTPKKQKAMMPPPPTLPKSKKQVSITPPNQKIVKQVKQITEQKTQSSNIFKKKQPNNQNLNMNLTLKVKKKEEQQKNIEQLKKISEGLSKIFDELKIRQDDQQELQLSLQLEDQGNQQMRLTLGMEEKKDDLMKTYEFKFSEFVRQLKQKYYPDMQTIIEKTHQFDSNDIYMNRQLIRKMSQMQLNQLASNQFIDSTSFNLNNQFNINESNKN